MADVTLNQGARLGPYIVGARLGAGGMGEVYRATDTRLGRAVAIKIINGPFSERVEREARAISAAVARPVRTHRSRWSTCTSRNCGTHFAGPSRHQRRDANCA